MNNTLISNTILAIAITAISTSVFAETTIKFNFDGKHESSASKPVWVQVKNKHVKTNEVKSATAMRFNLSNATKAHIYTGGTLNNLNANGGFKVTLHNKVKVPKEGNVTITLSDYSNKTTNKKSPQISWNITVTSGSTTQKYHCKAWTKSEVGPRGLIPVATAKCTTE